MRHAEREYRPDREEAQQVLTAKGQQNATQLGEKLARRLQIEGRSVSLMLTSPYARAFQTAALVAPHLGLALSRLQVLDSLAAEPDGSVEKSFAPVLAAASGGVVVVGHGPDLAEMSRRLGGQAIELKKANALAIEWDAAASRGRYLWQISYKG